MVTNISKRPRGRPKGFIPDEALDRAVEMFWEHGYEGVDVDRIARAVNVTKPALYRAFGDKSTLLLKGGRALCADRMELPKWQRFKRSRTSTRP